MLSTLTLAIGWSPEIRGITFVLIAVVVLCGSVYLLLSTNLGARSGFLVAFAGLFGWMFLMGAVWWAYGIGLQGESPTWQPVGIYVGTEALGQEQIVVGDTLGNPGDDISAVPGWTRIEPEEPAFGQAQASADDILINQAGVFGAGEYIVLGAYSKGGDRSPMIGSFDLLAFRHSPHHALVEVKPVVPQVVEPGRPLPVPVADTSQESTFVLMVRDMGYKRRPAALVTLGSGIIFGLSVWALRRRDRIVDQHFEQAAGASKA